MELIIGAVITILTAIIRKLSGKIGTEMMKNLTIIIVFVLALGGAFLFHKGVINEGFITQWTEISAYAIAIYEVVYKRIILPIFNQIK